MNTPTKQPQRKSDSPPMAGDTNRQNTPNIYLAPSTLSNSQLARGLSIGSSSSSTSTTNAINSRQSPNEIPVQPVSNKPRYMNSFAGTQSSAQTNSLTSVSSSIENTHLNSPGSSSSPKLPLSNQQHRQQHLSSRTHEQLVRSSISPNSPSRQHPANIQVERALQHQQQQRQPSMTNQPQQHQMPRQAAGDHRPGVYQNRPTIPNSNQRLEPSLVGVNNRVSKQSRPDSSASQVTRDKAMMALRDELKTNASRQHQQAPMNRNGPSSKNITSQNINYNLKETLNQNRVGTAIKRTSFDSDLPNNSANKKPNTSHGSSSNMHQQQMTRDPRQATSSMANRGHAPSSSGQIRHQQPGGSSSHPSHHYQHGHSKSGSNNGNGGSSSEAPFFINKQNNGAGGSYSQSRGGSGGLQSYANHGYHQQHMQQQQKMSSSG